MHFVHFELSGIVTCLCCVFLNLLNVLPGNNGRAKTRHPFDPTIIIKKPPWFQKLYKIKICEAWISLPHNSWNVPFPFPSCGPNCRSNLYIFTPGSLWSMGASPIQPDFGGHLLSAPGFPMHPLLSHPATSCISCELRLLQTRRISEMHEKDFYGSVPDDRFVYRGESPIPA